MSDLLRSYLVAWLFFLAISLGAMANLMLHSLTGGRWGQCVRPAWLAATRLMPVLALLFAPIAVGVSSIYPWSDTPGAWLNVPFFTARSIGYLLVWVVLAQAFLRADRASVDPALGANRSERRVAAAGLVIYALTMSLAAVDWSAREQGPNPNFQKNVLPSLQLLEAGGLWKARRWAEWLAVFTGLIYVPFEIMALVQNPGWQPVLALISNVAIVLFLAMQLRAARRQHRRTGQRKHVPPFRKAAHPA